MTIKDVELQTGLARANIRYYEDQGFFSAARGENGYRNYSDENVDILLRVKLLRQLGFSLEEIHALQKGEQSLDRALAERESGLEAERRALERQEAPEEGGETDTPMVLPVEETPRTSTPWTPGAI